MTRTEQSRAIARLNDQHRASPGVGWMMTPGVQTLAARSIVRAVAAVKAFDDFSRDNDPYGERDFGVVEIDGHKLFWKIDCYDLNLALASPDPADPTVTRRILTLMLAEEY